MLGYIKTATAYFTLLVDSAEQHGMIFKLIIKLNELVLSVIYYLLRRIDNGCYENGMRNKCCREHNSSLSTEGLLSTLHIVV